MMPDPARGSCSWPASRTARCRSTTDRTWTDLRPQSPGGEGRTDGVGPPGREVDQASAHGAGNGPGRVVERLAQHLFELYGSGKRGPDFIGTFRSEPAFSLASD